MGGKIIAEIGDVTTTRYLFTFFAWSIGNCGQSGTLGNRNLCANVSAFENFGL